MDLENEKIGPAYQAPDSYFKESESRLMQRLGIDINAIVVESVSVKSEVAVIQSNERPPLDTIGVQKRARKQDPITSKSLGINKELDTLGNVVIAPLTFTTNENPEWVNFGAIPAEENASQTPMDQQIKKVSFGDLLSSSDTNNAISHDALPVIETPEGESTVEMPLEILEQELISVSDEIDPIVETHEETEITAEVLEEVAIESAIVDVLIDEVAEVTPVVFELDVKPADNVVVHEVPESIGLDELESYIIAPQNSSRSESVNPIKSESTLSKTEQTLEVEEKPMSLEAPQTAFAPIAGRQNETATPGWLGIAAALAAVVAAYFIWTAIQPPKLDTEQVVLQQEEATIPEAPLDETVPTDTIPDGLQLVEPLIMEEMPKYIEPNVYSIIDAAEMPERTKQALQDLEDHGIATFDMEDELFEELDLESL